jgi:hypothetical protein
MKSSEANLYSLQKIKVTRLPQIDRYYCTFKICLSNVKVTRRVSFETSFDSKQPKLEPKLVSALSETKRLFRLFRFYTETASFGVSIELKQTEDQPKQTETNRNESNMKNI